MFDCVFICYVPPQITPLVVDQFFLRYTTIVVPLSQNQDIMKGSHGYRRRTTLKFV